MVGLGVGRVKTATFNLGVETPSRFRKFENQKCLRPAMVKNRSIGASTSCLLHPTKQTSTVGTVTSEKCHQRTPDCDVAVSCSAVSGIQMANTITATRAAAPRVRNVAL